MCLCEWVCHCVCVCLCVWVCVCLTQKSDSNTHEPKDTDTYFLWNVIKFEKGEIPLLRKTKRGIIPLFDLLFPHFPLFDLACMVVSEVISSKKDQKNTLIFFIRNLYSKRKLFRRMKKKTLVYHPNSEAQGMRARGILFLFFKIFNTWNVCSHRLK